MDKESGIPQRELPYRRWAVVVLMFSGIAIILFGCYVGQMLAEYGSFSGSLPVFLGGLFLIGLAIVFWLPMRKFVSTCEYVDARITNRYTKLHTVLSGSEIGEGVTKENRYWLVFQYDTDESQVTLRTQVSKSLFNKKPIGSSLEIRYSPQDPRIVQIEGGFFYWQ